KILCPYPSSAKDVGQWLIGESGLNIIPKKIEDAYKDYPSGYKGYHFSAMKDIPFVSIEKIHCEIQIKTMCQETWDAQTHDLSYKKADIISDDLKKHFIQLSNVLAAIDEQGDIIKNQIQMEEKEEQQKRHAAAFSLMSESNEIIEKLKKTTSIAITPESILDAENINDIYDFLNKNCNGELTISLCYFYILIAMLSKENTHTIYALEKSNDLLKKDPQNTTYIKTKMTAYCFLNKHKDIIEYIKETVNYIESIKTQSSDDLNIKNDICYWITDSIRIGINDVKLHEIAKKYAKELYKSKKSGYLDTVGFFYIVTGTIEEEIEDGLILINEAMKIIPENQTQIAKAFKDYHKLLAYKRLLNLSRKNKYIKT
ncbi:MAG: hypothetical protein HQK93_09535, partial [Nitrospirae bacterium]|nr:hypothetical protein [Nitrospirota bacterium]